MTENVRLEENTETGNTKDVRAELLVRALGDVPPLTAKVGTHCRVKAQAGHQGMGFQSQRCHVPAKTPGSSDPRSFPSRSHWLV